MLETNIVSPFAATVLSGLGSIEPIELPFVINAIESLERRNWLSSEVIAYTRWLEHVDPTIEEDVALRNMKRVEERVAQRLGVSRG
jgi:hypothetical protein